MELLQSVRTTFWSNRFWFPENMTWETMQNTDSGPYKDVYYPQLIDLLVPFPICFGLLLLRAFMNKYVYRPIGRYFNLKEGKIINPENVPTLQRYYKKVSKRPKHEELLKLAKDLQWPIRNIERWFRKRRNVDKSSMMTKFIEGSWRHNAYFLLHVLGVYILYDEAIAYDVKLCWTNWPHHHVTTEYYVYYMVELGFYWSLLISAHFDVKRSDYLEHVIHHILTIALMTFSWTSNLIRIGVWVLGIHDVVDHWLEAAKLCKYLKLEKLCEYCFAMFAGMWYITRLYIFPVYMVYNCWTMVEPWPAYGVMLVFLTALQILHILWSIPITKVAVRALVKNEYEDIRSDSECSLSGEENANELNGAYKNGNGVHKNGGPKNGGPKIAEVNGVHKKDD